MPPKVIAIIALKCGFNRAAIWAFLHSTIPTRPHKRSPCNCPLFVPLRLHYYYSLPFNIKSLSDIHQSIHLKIRKMDFSKVKTTLKEATKMKMRGSGIFSYYSVD